MLPTRQHAGCMPDAWATLDAWCTPGTAYHLTCPAPPLAELQSADGITVAGLSQLSSCRRLRSLKVFDCSRLSEQEQWQPLLKLVSSCPELQARGHWLGLSQPACPWRRRHHVQSRGAATARATMTTAFSPSLEYAGHRRGQAAVELLPRLFHLGAIATRLLASHPGPQRGPCPGHEPQPRGARRRTECPRSPRHVRSDCGGSSGARGALGRGGLGGSVHGVAGHVTRERGPWLCWEGCGGTLAGNVLCRDATHTHTQPPSQPESTRMRAAVRRSEASPRRDVELLRRAVDIMVRSWKEVGWDDE